MEKFLKYLYLFGLLSCLFILFSVVSVVVFSWYWNLYELYDVSISFWLTSFVSFNFIIILCMYVRLCLAQIFVKFWRWYACNWPNVGNFIYQVCWPYIFRYFPRYELSLFTWKSITLKPWVLEIKRIEHGEQTRRLKIKKALEATVIPETERSR